LHFYNIWYIPFESVLKIADATFSSHAWTVQHKKKKTFPYNIYISVYGVACWPLVPKFAGSNPAETVGFLRAKKILTTPSFGGEVKPSVPCRRFAACKISLMAWIEMSCRQNYGTTFLVHSSTFRWQDLSLRCGRGGTRRRKWERLNARESNGKLPLRTCPGCSVPNWSKGWIVIIINNRTYHEDKNKPTKCTN